MISRIVSMFSSKSRPAPRRVPTSEPLESRTLLHGAVISVYADNRGEVEMTFHEALNPATVNTRSVFVFTAGADDKFGTADDVKVVGRVKMRLGNRRIAFRPDAKVPFIAGSSYLIKVSSKLVKTAGGERIDGEFNGAGVESGNGVAGGDFLCVSKRNKTTLNTRFSTVLGNIDVLLFKDLTPKNVANFVTYMDNGDYDNTFVQRLIGGFIWQTGGYRVTPSNGVEQIAVRQPLAENEPTPTHAVRGTLSLARPDDEDPNTDDKGSNQFFFNLGDNRGSPPLGLDFQNGGFTEFGAVTSSGGLAVMDAIGNSPKVVGGGEFSDLAVLPGVTSTAQVDANPQGTLVTIRRIAIRNTIVAFTP